MADATVNTNTPAQKPLTLEPACVELLTNATYEIEQLTRILGTLVEDDDNCLIRRSVAVRIHDLNRVVQWALADDLFSMKEAKTTVYGPAWWGNV